MPPKPATRAGRFIADMAVALRGRTALLVLGVMVIQLGFIVSYVGAFHRPTPHGVKLMVAAPASVAPKLAGELNAIQGAPLKVSSAASSQAGLAQLRSGSTDAVLVVSPSTSRDTLYVSGGGGAATLEAVEQVISAAEATQQRSVRFVDTIPAQAGDARGLSGFYLVIGWLIGGYLAAAILSLIHGPYAKSLRGLAVRLAGILIYAVASGICGALIVGPWLGALTGHVLALWWVGALLVLTGAVVTMAFQALIGILGIGLTIVLFVVLGNPSAGGAYQGALLPAFWRVIGPYIPNGAGVDVVRRIVYFGASGIGGDIAVIAVYAVLGLAVTIAGTALRASRRRAATSS